MGKKNKSENNLGRALIKDRFGSSNSRRNKDSSLVCQLSKNYLMIDTVAVMVSFL